MNCLQMRVGDKALLVIMIEKANLERMKDGDPASLTGSDFPKIAALPFKNMDIWVCYEEDVSKIYGFLERGEQEKALKYISRNWTMKDDDGRAPVEWRP